MSRSLGWLLAAMLLAAMLLAAAGRPAGAAPSILTNVDYYDIEGLTPRALKQQMSALGPYDEKDKERYWAHLTWVINWRYQREQSGDLCRITSVTTDLRLDYVLPRWKDFSEASPEFQQLWVSFFEAIRSHEDEHARHGIEAANAIDAALRDFPPRPTCDDLEKAANAEAGAIADSYSAMDVAFDAETRHGSNEGVTLPDFLPPPPGQGASGSNQRVGTGFSPR